MRPSCQTDGTRGIAAAKLANHSCAGQAAMHLDAERFQRGSHEIAGSMFVKSQLGMRMQFTPEGDVFRIHAGRCRFAMEVIHKSQSSECGDHLS
jgi:hypothetical protein